MLIRFLTFLLGRLLGNRLAIGRDKRKEFNDAVAPIRGWLLREMDAPSPYTQTPSAQQIDLFVSYLWPWQRKAFIHHLQQQAIQRNSAQVLDEVGHVSYGNDAHIRQELRKLFKYTTLR